jgi:hypothetical protein
MNTYPFVKLLEKDKEIIIFKKSINQLFVKSKRGSKCIARIPLTINPETCFLSGCIISDGHLKKAQFVITIEMTDKEIIKMIKDKFEKVFLIKLKIYKRIDKRPNRKVRWVIKFQSKAIWLFFKEIFGIPMGKKSDIINVPKFIVILSPT